MTSLRTRTAEMLAFESNPSRDEWRKLVEELLKDALRYQWLRDNSLGPTPAIAVTYKIGHGYARVTELEELDSVIDSLVASGGRLRAKGNDDPRP